MVHERELDGNYLKRKIHGESCVEYISRIERSKDLMFMLGLNEAIDQLTIANSVLWYGHVLRRAVDFDVEGERKKGRPERTW